MHSWTWQNQTRSFRECKLRQGRNVNQKVIQISGLIRIWMSNGVRHFTKFCKNRLLTRLRNGKKRPKMPDSIMVKNGKVILNPHADPNQHQKLINSKGSSLACAYHVWSTSVSAFVSYPAHRMTNRQTETKLLCQILRTKNINNNNKMIVIITQQQRLLVECGKVTWSK